MDVFIFRENTEDVYIGIEWKSGSPEAKKLLEFLNNEMLKDGKKQIRWDSGVGIKPISPTGTKRLVRRAIKYALANKRKSVTLVHKGNIQKFTEGAFRDWGYELAREEFRAQTVTERERSEEHTSELQSRLHLVCRLLLEKKKNQHSRHTVNITSTKQHRHS